MASPVPSVSCLYFFLTLSIFTAAGHPFSGFADMNKAVGLCADINFPLIWQMPRAWPLAMADAEVTVRVTLFPKEAQTSLPERCTILHSCQPQMSHWSICLWVVFLLLAFESSLCILNASPLSNQHFTSISSQLVACHFTLTTVSFHRAEALNYRDIELTGYCSHAAGTVPKKPKPKSGRFCLAG